MNVLKVLNAALAFLLELGMLAAYGWWGFHAVSGWLRWVLAAAILGAVMTAWGIWAAPNSTTRLQQPLLLCLELGLLLLAALLVWRLGYTSLALVFAALATASQLLALWLKQ